MVRVAACIGIGVCFLGASVHAETGDLTYEEYRKEIGAGQERIDYSKRLVGHDQIHTLVSGPREGSESGEPDGQNDSKDSPDPEDDSKPNPDPSEEPGSDPEPEAKPEPEPETDDNPGDREKGDSDGDGEPTPGTPEPDAGPGDASEGGDTGGPAGNSGAQSGGSGGYEYVSPSLRMGGSVGQRNSARVVQSESQGPVFGISIGSEIPVRLDSSASNVQPGHITLKVQKTIVGRKETLPRGSQLFARSSAVLGSEKLYLDVTRGITPDGEEFRVRGVVFGDNREPGLVARVVNDGKALARASSEGLNALGKGLVNTIPGVGPGGSAASAAADQLLKEKERDDQVKQGRPAYVVIAGPQEAVVQIEETF